ncbi:MAG: YhcN/YlaJ family sporulation lipoprotein [Clostridiales bacterium]|nr:YhcN/YlaJ family sporulation lipoprotein [Clostridiales bacterium]
MKFFWNLPKLMLVIILITSVFSGCAVRRIPDTTYDNNSNNNRNNSGSYSPELGTPATEADRIAHAVQRVQGINNSAVVINGDIAYVGVNLDINENIDSITKIQSIKEQVANAVRNADPGITTVYVSADADFVEKITRMSRELRNGKPIESFKDELDNIVKRVTPEKQ